ncbi:MAG: chemotaxis protein CheW [Phycisphaerales bacterium]|nr:chemotaxis protein CheW [Phycisphaerales bacterium]
MRIVEAWLADQRCAIPIESIDEVLPLVEAHTIAGTPPWMLGMARLRGAFVPLIDATMIAKGTPTARTMNARIVLLRPEHCGGIRLALVVGRIGGLLSIDFASHASHPWIAGAGLGTLAAVAADEGGAITLLDPAALLTPEHRTLFRQAAQSR